MSKTLKNITINPNKIKVRDELVKNMITTTGGVARVFPDRRRSAKADKVGRHAKIRWSIHKDYD